MGKYSVNQLKNPKTIDDFGCFTCENDHANSIFETMSKSHSKFNSRNHVFNRNPRIHGINKPIYPPITPKGHDRCGNLFRRFDPA